jgi:hypothetical protein
MLESNGHPTSPDTHPSGPLRLHLLPPIIRRLRVLVLIGEAAPFLLAFGSRTEKRFANLRHAAIFGCRDDLHTTFEISTNSVNPTGPFSLLPLFIGPLGLSVQLLDAVPTPVFEDGLSLPSDPRRRRAHPFSSPFLETISCARAKFDPVWAEAV